MTASTAPAPVAPTRARRPLETRWRVTAPQAAAPGGLPLHGEPNAEAVAEAADGPVTGAEALATAGGDCVGGKVKGAAPAQRNPAAGNAKGAAFAGAVL